MFNKRIVADVKLEKAPKNEDIDNEIAQEIGQSATNIINGVIEDCLRPAAKIVVGSIVTVAVVSSICKIAVKSTPTR